MTITEGSELVAFLDRFTLLRRLPASAASRWAAILLAARPALRLWVILAGWRNLARNRAAVDGKTVRVVDARVRCSMAIIPGQSVASVHGSVCLDQVRGRAITARAAIRVDCAIASRCTKIRTVVGRRGAANTRRPRRTIRIGEALVVRTPAGPNRPFRRKATTVSAAGALGVRGAARCHSGPVRLGERRRTALRGAACRHGPMVDGNLRVARQACSRFEERRRTGQTAVPGLGGQAVAGAGIDLGRGADTGDPTTAGRERAGDEKEGGENSHDFSIKHDTCHAQLRVIRYGSRSLHGPK
jgi:hypothetical protein